MVNEASTLHVTVFTYKVLLAKPAIRQFIRLQSCFRTAASKLLGPIVAAFEMGERRLATQIRLWSVSAFLHQTRESLR